MGLPNQSAGIMRAGIFGATGMVLLPQLDTVLSRILSVCGLTLLGIIIVLKIVARYRNRRRSK